LIKVDQQPQKEEEEEGEKEEEVEDMEMKNAQTPTWLVFAQISLISRYTHIFFFLLCQVS
jgi:hypothetical protein